MSPSARQNTYDAALRQIRGALFGAALFSAAINVLMLTGSLYMLQVYDRVLPSGSLTTLWGLFAVVVLLYAFLGIYDFLRSRILARAALKLDVLVGPPAFHAWLGLQRNAARGQDMPTPLRDLDTVRGFLGGPAPHGLFDLPWMPLYLGILFLVHPWLGWLTVAGAAIVAVVALVNRMLTERSMGRAMALDSTARSFAEQGQRNAESLRALGMEAAVTREWQALHAAALAAGQQGSNVGEATSAFSKAFRLLLQSAILTLGALLVLRHELSAGMIIACSILSGRALAPVDQVIGQWRSISRARLSHHRLRDFFAASAPAAQLLSLPPPTGAIEVTRLTRFIAQESMGGEARRSLNQVSFSLAPGDGLGVIGNSAAGKTTLARLLVGAWAADAGEIRLDGAALDQWPAEELGRHIGYLPQKVDLLPGTIGMNIARFDPTARDEAILAAAEMAGVHRMILALPQGYATRVGGGEAPLSGGQIQRIGLARALFGNPRIVVLDEPNSNLDMSGDTALTNAITALRGRGTTVIVMAHRPSALAAVNKLMLLHNGSMVNFGEKEEVMRSLAPTAVPSAGAQPAAVADAAARPAVSTLQANASAIRGVIGSAAATRSAGQSGGQSAGQPEAQSGGRSDLSAGEPIDSPAPATDRGGPPRTAPGAGPLGAQRSPERNPERSPPGPPASPPARQEPRQAAQMLQQAKRDMRS